MASAVAVATSEIALASLLGAQDLGLLAPVGDVDVLLVALALGGVDLHLALALRLGEIVARFSRSAVICSSMACRIACGGVMSLISS